MQKKQITNHYEIVWITNPNELNQNRSLVNEFFNLYEDPSNFPDPDEREEPHFIEERILEQCDDPRTHLMAFNIIEDGIKKFAAGCIVELYVDSQCALVTYVFVNKNYRGLRVGEEKKRIAEILLKGENGLKGLVGYFKEMYGIKPKAVLFESNNPFQTLEANDSMPPAKRLKFFKSIGAKRVNFDYVQPPLGDDKDLVSNLFLLTFPDLAGLTDNISAETIMAFIMELAKSLDRNKEDNSLSKYGLDNYRNDRKVLLEKLKGTNPIEESNFIGLTVNNRNILTETYKNLIENSSSLGFLTLTEIPGAE